MKTCPPNHFRRACGLGLHICVPRLIPYRGFVISASLSGLSWRPTDGFGTIYACPIPDGEDLRWDPSFATIKEAKMGIDHYISWLVTFRLMREARSA